MHSSKKSQAALEFIMTYGWAILVVLVAIGALAYFGVLSPDKFLPRRCTLPTGIACVDFEARDAGGGATALDISLRNSLGYDIISVTVKATGCTTPATYPLIKNGEREPRTLTVQDCAFLIGQKYNGQVNISFTNADTGVSHTFQGVIITKVTSTS